MTELELRPLIARLYTELLSRFNAEAKDASDGDGMAGGAEALANQFIQGIKEADELDDLLSLSTEEIRGLFNNSDLGK